MNRFALRLFLVLMLVTLAGRCAEPKVELLVPTAVPANALAISPRGTLVATSDARRITWIDARTLVPLRTVKRPGKAITLRPIVFSPDERFLFAGNSENQKLEKFDVRTGAVVQTISLPADATVENLSASPDGKFLVVFPRFLGTVFVVDVPAARAYPISLPKPFDIMSSYADWIWLADGKRLLVSVQKLEHATEKKQVPAPANLTPEAGPPSSGPQAAPAPSEAPIPPSVTGFVTIDAETRSVSISPVLATRALENWRSPAVWFEKAANAPTARVIIAGEHRYDLSLVSGQLGPGSSTGKANGRRSASPGGRFEARCCEQGLQIGQAEDGRELFSIPDVSFAGWAPDSGSFYMWQADALRRIDLSGRQLASSPAPQGDIAQLATLENGAQLYVEYDSHTSVWSLERGAPVETRKRSKMGIELLAHAASGNGAFSLSALPDAHIQVHLSGKEMLHDVDLNVKGGVVNRIATDFNGGVALAKILHEHEIRAYHAEYDKLLFENFLAGQEKWRAISSRMSGELAAIVPGTGKILWKQHHDDFGFARIGVSRDGRRAYVWKESGALFDVDMLSGRMVPRGTVLPFEDAPQVVWLDKDTLGFARDDGSMLRVGLANRRRSMHTVAAPGATRSVADETRLLSVYGSDTAAIDPLAGVKKEQTTAPKTRRAIRGRYVGLRISDEADVVAGVTSTGDEGIEVTLGNGRRITVPTAGRRAEFWIDGGGKWLVWTENCRDPVFVQLPQGQVARFAEGDRPPPRRRHRDVGGCESGGFLNGSRMFALPTMRGLELWDMQRLAFIGIVEHRARLLDNFRYDASAHRLVTVAGTTNELETVALADSTNKGSLPEEWHRLSMLPAAPSWYRWALTADGKEIVIARRGGLDVLKADSGALTRQIEHENIDTLSSVHRIAQTQLMLVVTTLQPEAPAHVTSAPSGRVRGGWTVIDVARGAVLSERTLDLSYLENAGGAPEQAFAVSENGRAVAWVDEQGRTQSEVVSAGPKHLSTFRFMENVGELALRSGHPHVFAGTGDGWVLVLDAVSGAELARVRSDCDGHWVVLAPDGRFDTDALAPFPLYSVSSAAPFTPIPVPLTGNSSYTPKLLAKVLRSGSD